MGCDQNTIEYTKFMFPANQVMKFCIGGENLDTKLQVLPLPKTYRVPNMWKIAVVTPIPKEGDDEVPNNNRPISLLPVLSKVCERVAHNQFSSYLLSRDHLSCKQSGNKQWHSTETSLIHTTDTILSAIDKKKINRSCST